MHNLLLLSLFLLSGALYAEDAVDRLTVKYSDLERKGLIGLHTRNLTELRKVKDAAMELKDLSLANKADSKIKALETEIRKLGGAATVPNSSVTPMPSNSLYKMISHNGRRGTEHGKEIICKFQRVTDAVPAGTLTLTLSSNTSKFSNTPMEIFILNGSKGPVIGSTKGIRTGKTKKIPLSTTAAKELEIVVVVRGHEALHLKPFSGSDAPELYLTVE